MAKKTKKRNNSERKKKNNSAYTINDKIVIAYARFHSTPLSLRKPELRSATDFLVANGYSKNSLHTLQGFSQIAGFWELRQKFATQYHSYYEEVADTGLLKRAEGMKAYETHVKETDEGTETTEIVKDVLPDVGACIAIKKIFGKYKEEVQLSGLGDIVRQIAGMK